MATKPMKTVHLQKNLLIVPIVVPRGDEVPVHLLLNHLYWLWERVDDGDDRSVTPVREGRHDDDRAWDNGGQDDQRPKAKFWRLGALRQSLENH